jgi:hypothetical protein
MLAVAVNVEFCVGHRKVELADKLTAQEPPRGTRALLVGFDVLGALIALEDLLGVTVAVFKTPLDGNAG